MRTSTLFRSALATLTAVAALATAGAALADEEFDVAVSAGKVTVTAKGKWHVNKDYPWKLTIGDQKLDQSKFKLTETAASVDAPKGKGKLKGGVCSGDQCKMFQVDVDVP